MQRILIIEDNPDLAFGLRNNLEIEGYRIEVAEDGRKGLASARTLDPDLIILDLMMPGMDGYGVLRALREEGRHTPVLILSARGEEADKVAGFRLGADDYVTKPFSLMELLARVTALLRRAGPKEPDPQLGFGDVLVDPVSQRVTRQGEVVTLTHREFRLLLALLERRNRVVSRLELLKAAWGNRGAVTERTVDSHIAELRKKLDDPADPRHIITIRHGGYRLQD